MSEDQTIESYMRSKPIAFADTLDSLEILVKIGFANYILFYEAKKCDLTPRHVTKLPSWTHAALSLVISLTNTLAVFHRAPRTARRLRYSRRRGLTG